MDDLYTRDLLRHAAEAAGAGRLPAPNGSASLTNPLCGDRVIIDVMLENGRIAAIGHQVRACVLCQGSASILAKAAPGQASAAIAIVMQDIERALQSGRLDFDAPWVDFSVFAPAAPIKSRHNCVLLPFRGLVAAIEACG